MRARAFWRSNDGASALEFALVSPVLLLFLAGIIAFGFYFVVAHNVQQLAAEAARATVPGLNSNERSALATGQIASSIETYPLLRRENLKITVDTVSGNANLYRVVLSYDASYIGIWSLEGIVPLPPSTIERGTVIRRGGY